MARSGTRTALGDIGVHILVAALGKRTRSLWRERCRSSRNGARLVSSRRSGDLAPRTRCGSGTMNQPITAPRIVIDARAMNRTALRQREWIVTNGIGGYASGTLCGEIARRYHGLLTANLASPSGRHLMISRFDQELVGCENRADSSLHDSQVSGTLLCEPV